MSFQVSYIYDLVDKITPQLQKIQTSINQTTAAVQTSAAKISTSFGSAGVAVNAFGQKLRNMSTKVGAIGRDMFVKTTVPIGLAFGKFIKTASDYNESINKVEVAFGGAASSVKDFAQQAGKSFGIDRGNALDMAAMFGDMSTSMGLSEEKAATLSTSLVGLAGDLASFKNIGVDQATTALAGIFTGETESLKRLGVVMTEANLQQFALARGINKKVQEMRQDEKVLLRYAFIMQMTKNSQGDFLRTQEGFANQMRILRARFNDLSISLGAILLPMANKFLGWVIRIIEKFQALSPETQKTILIIAGLVAVLSPLLIMIGFVGSGIGALITGIGALSGAFAFLAANPIVAVIAAMVLLYNTWDDFKVVVDYVASIIGSAFKSDGIHQFITDLTTVLGLLADIGDFFIKYPKMLGNFVAEKINNKLDAQAGIQPTQLQTPVLPRQQIDTSGTLDVRFQNAPSGTRANYTPMPKSNLNAGAMGGY